MLDYPALFALAAVVHEGSFERAARVLNVTPSAVSQRIRLLEERVGCALVVRGQPCEATETGRRLCHHVDRLRLLEHELQESMPGIGTNASSRTPVRAALPIAVNADSLATWFAPAMTAFATSAPVLMRVAVDDEGHTAEWLRKGTVLAAVTALDQAATGCNSLALGAMRYVAAASPSFVQHYFAQGVDASSLASAPSLLFSAKDELQQRWAQRHCQQPIALPGHTLPSTHVFVTAALAGMGWALHPQCLIDSHLRSGQLVELVPGTPLDVPLYWQQARAASSLLEGLTLAVLHAARQALVSG